MKYTWERKDYCAWNHSIFDSIEECVEDAKRHKLKAGDIIKVAKLKPWEASTRASRILGRLVESAERDCINFNENWTPDDYFKYKLELDVLSDRIMEVVDDYLKDIKQVPEFYTVDGSFEVIIP